jgi:hypothetical protein
MTREEAVKLVKEVTGMSLDWDDAHYEALQMAIKALEQESILDKIRAEIEALNPEPTAYDVVDGNPIKDAVWETLSDVLKIIDKYKAESEE